MKTFDQILAELKQGKYAPLYIFHGEEPYYIDQLAGYIEENVLKPEEKDFNLSIVYGSDLDGPAILDLARRYPVFADYQVIIIREAQKLKNLEALESYVAKPVETSILVLCYKYKKLDGRTKFSKNAEKSGVVYESKKLYDNQVPGWISAFLQGKGYRIEPQAAIQWAESVGTDISRVNNEFQKLVLNIAPKSTITPTMVEQYIGISKEFNVFELSRALGARDPVKANRILHFMMQNPRENPMVKIIPILHNYFNKVLLCQHYEGKQGASLSSVLGVSPVFVNEYKEASQKYQRKKLLGITQIIREYDLKNKGIGSETKEESELMKELIYKIIH